MINDLCFVDWLIEKFPAASALAVLAGFIIIAKLTKYGIQMVLED